MRGMARCGAETDESWLDDGWWWWTWNAPHQPISCNSAAVALFQATCWLLYDTTWAIYDFFAKKWRSQWRRTGFLRSGRHTEVGNGTGTVTGCQRLTQVEMWRRLIMIHGGPGLHMQPKRSCIMISIMSRLQLSAWSIPLSCRATLMLYSRMRVLYGDGEEDANVHCIWVSETWCKIHYLYPVHGSPLRHPCRSETWALFSSLNQACSGLLLGNIRPKWGLPYDGKGNLRTININKSQAG